MDRSRSAAVTKERSTRFFVIAAVQTCMLVVIALACVHVAKQAVGVGEANIVSALYLAAFGCLNGAVQVWKRAPSDAAAVEEALAQAVLAVPTGPASAPSPSLLASAISHGRGKLPPVEILLLVVASALAAGLVLRDPPGSLIATVRAPSYRR